MVNEFGGVWILATFGFVQHKAVQEQQVMIKAQQEINQKLQQENRQLKARLDKMEVLMVK